MGAARFRRQGPNGALERGGHGLQDRDLAGRLPVSVGPRRRDHHVRSRTTRRRMRTIFGLTSSLLLMLAAGAGAVEDSGPLPADGRCAPFSQTEPGHVIPSWDGTP